MEYYKFIVKRSDQTFAGIVKVTDNETTSAERSIYSTLISDEETARVNFTLTGHLPSEKFEELLKDAKNETIAL